MPAVPTLSSRLSSPWEARRAGSEGAWDPAPVAPPRPRAICCQTALEAVTHDFLHKHTRSLSPSCRLGAERSAARVTRLRSICYQTALEAAGPLARPFWTPAGRGRSARAAAAASPRRAICC